MHDNDVITTADQVRRLLAAQFPQWADLPVTSVAEFGTDHLLWRLGDDLVARMPRIEWAVEQADSDARWLPVLAPELPLGVPVTLAVGEPGEGYPWRWSVVEWLPGEALTPHNADPEVVATQLAGFVRALASVPPGDGPTKTGTARGVPLANLDSGVRECIAGLVDFDRAGLEAVWADAVAAPAWSGRPCWIHGDLLPGNLLVRDRRLTAVIDWGSLGLGDPAAELHAAYALFDPDVRRVFRELLPYDDAAWRRARGWALAPSISGVTYYAETVPAFAERSRRMIAAVLAELA